jgi:uncharacterized protein YggE
MPAENRVIRVVGEGTETGTPDNCRVALNLVVLADTPPLAMEKIAALASSVTACLRELAIADRDIQTVAIQVHEWFDQPSQRVTAHLANYGLSVKVRGLDQVGPMLTAVGEVAGEALKVQGVQLAISDLEPLRKEARRKAVEDAGAKATELAEAAELELGPVLSIEEAGWRAPGMPVVGFAQRRFVGLAAAAAPIPVEAGSFEVAVNVEVVYTIRSDS